MKKLIYLLAFVFILQYGLKIDNCTAQWEYMPVPTGQVTVFSLTSCGNNIIAATQFYGVFVSTNNGTNWTKTMSNWSVFSLASNENYVFAGTWNHGVQVSTNGGMFWSQTSLQSENVYSVGIIGNNNFAGTDHGIFISTDNGGSWTRTLFDIIEVHSFAAIGNNTFAGTEVGIYLSTNNGTNWVQTSLNNRDVRALIVSGNNIFAGTFGPYGVYLSSNNGVNWVPTSLNDKAIYSLAVGGNYIVAGTQYNGVYVSSDNGASWTQRNEGLFEGYKGACALCIFNNYIFAGIYKWQQGVSGVYRRPWGEIVSIQPISSEVSETFALSQNYPNPFNPVTKIKFSLPLPSEGGVHAVRLVIYDVLGREVAVLIPSLRGGQEGLKPGTYEVEWNASGYPSGVYFYKLITDGYTETKKMMLIK